VAAKALPLYQDEARKRQEMGAEMTHQKLGRATNPETLPPISEEGFSSLPKKAGGRAENESSYQAGKAAGVGKTTVKAAGRVVRHATAFRECPGPLS
jgi:hypothetical protein